ncbi:MAG: hypothetical protein ABGX12_02705 [Desulfurobacteriaceae bacterium]
MEREYIKEKVKFYTEVLKVLSAFLIASSGGTLGMLFKRDEKLAFWIAIVGIWASLTLLLMIGGLAIKIELLLKELRNE